MRTAVTRTRIRYRNAYPIIRGLGTDVVVNGDPNVPVSGVCISNAARRQSDSLGMIRLVVIPTLIAVSFCNSAPNCSTQPPMNARPYDPATTEIFARSLHADLPISLYVISRHIIYYLCPY